MTCRGNTDTNLETGRVNNFLLDLTPNFVIFMIVCFSIDSSHVHAPVFQWDQIALGHSGAVSHTQPSQVRAEFLHSQYGAIVHCPKERTEINDPDILTTANSPLQTLHTDIQTTRQLNENNEQYLYRYHFFLHSMK